MLFNLLLVLFTLLVISLTMTGLLILWSTIRYGIPPIPTDQETIQQMIELADLKDGITIYDLGCGDGRILRMVDKESRSKNLESRFIGIEGNPFMAGLARLLNQVTKKSHIQIIKGDFFTSDLSQADLIFCYLRPSIMNKFFIQKWTTLKSGCQVVSHAFTLPIPEAQSHEIKPGIKVYQYIKL